jgi:hypothetical protein
MKVLISTALLFIAVFSYSQQSLIIKVTSGKNKISVPATLVIKETVKGFTADSLGMAVIFFTGNGNYTLIISAVGYKESNSKIIVPYPAILYMLKWKQQKKNWMK